jgi:hypothetical protein
MLQSNLMKLYPILFLVFFMNSASFSQKIDEKKIIIDYIQLPSVPINKTIANYNPIVILAYEADINASKEAFKQKVKKAEDQYNLEMQNYLNKVREAEEKYNKDLDEYESRMKNFRQGTDTTKPVRQSFTGPRKITYTEGNYLNMYDPVFLASYIKIEGFKNNSDNALTLKVFFKGFESVAPELVPVTYKYKVKGKQMLGLMYQYKILYRHTAAIKPQTPQGPLPEINPDVLNEYKIAETATYATEEELKSYWEKNKDLFLNSLQDQIIKDNMITINQLLNEKFGYLKKKREIEINIPTEKKFSYNDYADAYVNVLSGYNMIGTGGSKDQVMADIKKAIAIWEKALTESNTKDRKGRVNENVTIATDQNLAEAYMWINDFRSAEMYLNKLTLLNLSGKEKKALEKNREFMKFQKARFDAQNQ